MKEQAQTSRTAELAAQLGISEDQLLEAAAQQGMSRRQLEMVEVEAKVLRADGSVEDYGRIAYWHRNPIKRIWGRLHQRGGLFAGRVVRHG